MQHLQHIHPLFVAAGEGELTGRVRAAGIETVVLPTPAAWQRVQRKKGKAAKLHKVVAVPTLAAHIHELSTLIRTRNAIGIHANSTRAALLAGLAARIADVPMWWHLRRERTMGISERLAYTLCDQVICIARDVKRSLGDAPKAIVIHDGIPADRLNYNASGAALRARLGWPANALVVGAVASLAPNKRHDLFINMALSLADAFPQAHFLIAGHRPAGVEPSFSAELHALAQPLETKGRLVFLDWLEEISEVFAAMDVFVHASDNEGLGLASIEAMQMGVAVVRTNTAGAEDMISDGKTGFIIPPGDLNALIERVQQLLADASLRQSLARAGMAFARAEFTAQRMASQLEEMMLSRK